MTQPTIFKMLIVIFIMLSLLCTSAARHSPVQRDIPAEDPCASCELDFSSRMGRTVCDMQLILAESYMECRTICNGFLGVEDETNTGKKAEAIENCRCLCKELKLKDKCSEDSCNSPFKEIQCSNITLSIFHGVSRCFEKRFEDAQAFNECATERASLPPSILESLDQDLEGGVEQCVCDCKYVERQSPIEAPTAISNDSVNVSAIADSCSITFDCTLNTKTKKTIETRIINNGTSFQDCRQNCRAVFENTGPETKDKSKSDKSDSSHSATKWTHSRTETKNITVRTRTDSEERRTDIRTRTGKPCTTSRSPSSYHTRTRARTDSEENRTDIRTRTGKPRTTSRSPNSYRTRTRGRTDSGESRTEIRPRTGKPRTTSRSPSSYRTRTIMNKTSLSQFRRSITSVDAETCDCYCSMLHDPCLASVTEQSTTIADVSDDPCSHDFDCTLSFKTRNRIGSIMDDNGNSFSDCHSRCISELDTMPRSRKMSKTKVRVNAEDCVCYCAMFHDPCPEAPSATTETEPCI